jgi:hypothetical protein
VTDILIQEVFFLPPLAIARVGASETPMDSFVWDSDSTVHGANRTVIQPAVSLNVLPDGSLSPYWPRQLQFRDGPLLRPVAPFFELWITLQSAGAPDRPLTRPLTSALLRELGATLDNVEYTITVANRKAQRRTGSAACAYIARATVGASDHARKQLPAFSPHTSGKEPLVFQKHPIPLGYFQALKPIERRAMGVDLDVLRVRFTPATGQVYGPPDASAGPASPLPQGVALAPVTLGGRLHEIVPKENRILNPNTPWSRYIMDKRGDDPQPSDSYDGANVGDNRSWGVVDDTCDGIIEAHVIIGSKRCTATTRVFSSNPDYAPDRRPFYSVADDLADRDPPPVEIGEAPLEEEKDETELEIGDLFDRAFETASLFNLDALRHRAILENLGNERPSPKAKPPKLDEGSMTDADTTNKSGLPLYADLTADLFPFSREKSKESRPRGHQLRYAKAAEFAHAKLCDLETLLEFLRTKPERVKALIRPPYARFSQLPRKKRAKPAPNFRDPRLERDLSHDMRMPPYMRDSDNSPLSVTNRQYEALMTFIEVLLKRPPRGGRPDSPIARRIEDVGATRSKKMSSKIRTGAHGEAVEEEGSREGVEKK